MLKTLKDQEKKLLFDNNVLRNYFIYIRENPKSILCKIYGVFTIRLPMVEEITVYIMDNMLGKDFANIERIYDLKGSTKGRKVELTKEEQSGAEKTGLTVLKDLNYLHFMDKMDIHERDRSALSQIIALDARFLQANNLMDYSLLFIKAS